MEVMREFRKATASALERNKIRLKDAVSAAAGAGADVTTSSSFPHKKTDDDDEDDDEDDVGDDGGDGDEEGSITAGMTDEYGNFDDSCSDAGSYTDGHGVTGRRGGRINPYFRSIHPVNTPYQPTHSLHTLPYQSTFSNTLTTHPLKHPINAPEQLSYQST